MKTHRGFTFIELLIVMAVMAVIATISLVGLRNNDDNQLVKQAQLDFISNFRSLQNNVFQGGDGINYKYIMLSFPNPANVYRIYNNAGVQVGDNIQTPSGVRFKVPNPAGGNYLVGGLAVCVSNPNMTSYDNISLATKPCAPSTWGNACDVGSYFACLSDGSAYNPFGKNGAGSAQVQFYKGTAYRCANIEGNGMLINRIYDAPCIFY